MKLYNMKHAPIRVLLISFTLSLAVNGAWWVATIQPVILSICSVFAALELDLLPNLDLQPIEWRRWTIFKNEKKKEEAAS